MSTPADNRFYRESPSAWNVQRVVQLAHEYLTFPPPKEGETDPNEDVLDHNAELLAKIKEAGADLPKLMEHIGLHADRARREAELLAAQIRAWQARKTRIEDAYERSRMLALSVIDALPEAFPERKFHSALVDIGVRNGKPGVVVTDIDKLEPRFVKVIREPKKIDIATAIRDGEVVEGAEMRNGSPYATIKIT